MDQQLKPQYTFLDYWKFLSILIAILFLGFIIISYITTEINTSVHASQISNLDELCKVTENQDFKYVKIIEYEKAFNRARIYCIYGDSSKNLELNLNFTNSRWQAFLTTKLNKERNFYWPIYI